MYKLAFCSTKCPQLLCYISWISVSWASLQDPVVISLFLLLPAWRRAAELRCMAHGMILINFCFVFVVCIFGLMRQTGQGGQSESSMQAVRQSLPAAPYLGCSPGSLLAALLCSCLPVLLCTAAESRDQGTVVYTDRSAPAVIEHNVDPPQLNLLN